MPHSKPIVVLSGMIAGDPHQGGATWAVLQYLLGLRQLGCDVYFVEPVQPAALHGSSGAIGNSVQAAYFRQVMARFDLEEHAALLLAGTQETIGLRYAQLREIAAGAEVLINISGMLTDETFRRIPVRAWLDLDPGFNQLWQAQGIDMRMAGHTHFVTIGQAIGRPECPVPKCGFSWITTPQPIVLSHWPVAGPIVHDAFTTVGNWRSYGSITADGVFYGQKLHSLRQFFPLPRLTGDQFLLAMSIHADERADLEAIRSGGWRLIEPGCVAGSPDAYREFIQGSLAELGIAKSGYVAADCGWFSDRSLCYLASGRPVVAQETGISRFLPTGAGLLAFRTLDEAADAVRSVRSDYARHSRAARGLAEEHFESARVLSRLLDRLGVGL